MILDIILFSIWGPYEIFLFQNNRDFVYTLLFFVERFATDNTFKNWVYLENSPKVFYLKKKNAILPILCFLNGSETEKKIVSIRNNRYIVKACDNIRSV